MVPRGQSVDLPAALPRDRCTYRERSLPALDHGHAILVAITMHPNLMACLSDSFHLFRECLDRMAGNEPGGLDAQPLKHLQQSG